MKHYICFVNPDGTAHDMQADSLDKESRVAARVEILKVMDKGGFVISHKNERMCRTVAMLALREYFPNLL